MAEDNKRKQEEGKKKELLTSKRVLKNGQQLINE